MRLSRFVPVLLSLVFSACASLNEKDCRNGNWFGIGTQDGMKGESSSRLAKHTDACKEYGVMPDHVAYEKGRQEGLKSFCTPENGYRIGKDGRSYGSVCPASLEGPFLKKYNAGRQIHDLQSEVSSLYSRIGNLESEIDREKDSSRRSRLREDLRDLSRRKDEAQRQLTVLEVREGA